MTPDEVLSRVEQEIGGNWDRESPHSLDLRRCVLRPPRREVFHSRTTTGEPVRFDLWLVLIEDPGVEKGYAIFYDDEDDVYGLALKAKDGTWSYIADYGTFLETVEAM